MASRGLLDASSSPLLLNSSMSSSPSQHGTGSYQLITAASLLLLLPLDGPGLGRDTS
jgi:hypothetical protein